MKFQEQFPSLISKALITKRKNIEVEWEETEERDILFSNVRILQSDDIQKHCLDKQKVKEAIEGYIEDHDRGLGCVSKDWYHLLRRLGLEG